MQIMIKAAAGIMINCISEFNRFFIENNTDSQAARKVRTAPERRQEEKGERAPREGEMRCRSSEKINKVASNKSNVRSTFISTLCTIKLANF